MGVTGFLIVLLSGGIFLLSYTGTFVKQTITPVKKPLIEAYDSVLYSINQKEISKIVKSSTAYIYNNKKELYNAAIVFKNKQDTNTIDAKYILEKKDKLFLEGDIYYTNSQQFSLLTQSLVYNINQQLLTNKVPFIAYYKTNKFSGNSLFYDLKTNHLKAKNIKFQVKEKL